MTLREIVLKLVTGNGRYLSRQYGRKGVRMTKIDIISGFLGAGKTTFIKKLLEEAIAGEQVVLTCEDDPGRSVTGQVYRASQTALEELCGWLGQHPWNLTVWTDTRLEGTVEMDEAGMLFTTIPYDKGWTIWVDGQKMSGQKMAEAFLGVSVPKGKHEIVMKYMPQGLLNGAGISAGSILLILALAWGTRIRRKQALGGSDQIPGNEEKEEER